MLQLQRLMNSDSILLIDFNGYSCSQSSQSTFQKLISSQNLLASKIAVKTNGFQLMCLISILEQDMSFSMQISVIMMHSELSCILSITQRIKFSISSLVHATVSYGTSSKLKQNSGIVDEQPRIEYISHSCETKLCSWNSKAAQLGFGIRSSASYTCLRSTNDTFQNS